MVLICIINVGNLTVVRAVFDLNLLAGLDNESGPLTEFQAS